MGEITNDEYYEAFKRAAADNAVLAPLPGESLAGWWARFERQKKRLWDREDEGGYEVLGVMGAVCHHLRVTYDVVLKVEGDQARFYPRNPQLLD